MLTPQESIEMEFRRHGALRASDLSAALGMSQPTVSRSLRRIGRSLIRLGRGRSTLYAMTREIAGAGSAWPLYAIDANGKPRHVGELHALQNRQWCLAQDEPWEGLRGDEFPLGLYPDLPWFLDDLRPQGFLGHAFARRYGWALGFPADPRAWSADEVVMGLLRFGQDLQGSFVLGEPMLSILQERWITPPEAVPVAGRPGAYLRLAEEMLRGEWPGSSAAGEQPKFITRILEDDGSIHHVIVKFSGGGGRPEDGRWRDLLVAEHIAATVLSAHGIPAAATCLIEAGGRVFLESRRFDRVGEHGRRGLVSLGAVDGAFFGEPHTPWAAAARRLRTDGWLTVEDAGRLTVLWWFGSLIANTDMHYGNASLFLGSARPLSLAPSYDMLPMLYRPDLEGALPDREFRPPPPVPEHRSAWAAAAEMAEVFWAQISESQNISDHFRSIGRRNQEIIVRYRRQFE